MSGTRAKPFRTDPIRKLLLAGEENICDTTRAKPHNRRVPVAEFGQKLVYPRDARNKHRGQTGSVPGSRLETNTKAQHGSELCYRRHRGVFFSVYREDAIPPPLGPTYRPTFKSGDRKYL